MAAVIGVVILTVWRNSYEEELKKARADAQQLKAERDKVKADRDQVWADWKRADKNQLAALKEARGEIPEGEIYPRPALESVAIPPMVADLLDYNSIHVYRWRGGTLEGWVQFQTDTAPVKQDLQVSEHAKKYVHPIGQPYDPRGVSGQIMIALKRRKDTGLFGMSDCLVGIEYSVRNPKDNTGIGSSYTLAGAIDASKVKQGVVWSARGLSLGGFMGGNEAVGFFSRGLENDKFPFETNFRLYQFKVSTAAAK